MAQSGTLLERARSSGELTVGFAIDPPWSLAKTDGSFTGIGSDIATAILNEMGIKRLNAVVVDFGNLIPGLVAKRFDAVGSSMYINATRCEQVLFSNPFLVSEEGFAVAPGNPFKLSDFKSVAEAGARLGLIGGSAEFQYAADAGVSTDKIVTFKDVPTAIAGLAAGRADVVAYDFVGLDYEIHNTNAKLEMTKPFIPIVGGEEKYGANAFTFRKEDASLRDEFNVVQAKLLASGRIAEIAEGYVKGVSSGIEPAMTLSVEALCAAK